MSWLIPAFFTHHLLFYTLPYYDQNLSVILPLFSSLPPPNTTLISSIMLPISPPKQPHLYSHRSPCMASSFLLTHLAPTCPHSCSMSMVLLLCSHNTVLRETHELARGSASGEFPALMDTGQLWKCEQSSSPKQNTGHTQRDTKVLLKTMCLLQLGVYL